jgi:hypothetical protein
MMEFASFAICQPLAQLDIIVSSIIIEDRLHAHFDCSNLSLDRVQDADKVLAE